MIWNLFLMLTWAALTNDFSAKNLFVGFVIGFLALGGLALRGVPGSIRYPRRTYRVLSFLSFYVTELVLANLRMARDVIVSPSRLRPALVAVPLDVKNDSDIELTLFANLVNLTPGTLAVDFSPDHRILYVHTVEVPGGDIERFRQQIKHDLERRVLEVLR